MKKSIFLFSLILSTTIVSAQNWKDQAQKVYDKATSGTGLSTDQIISGLKEALGQGSFKATDVASKDKGFYNNQLIKIPFPKDALKIKNAAERFGLQSQVTNFEIQLNKAAEEASKQALPILKEAIKGLNFNDAKAILNGSDNAATNYLKGKTNTKLNATFTPIVKNVINNIQLTKYYRPLAESYNKTIGFFGKKENVNPDLTAYVTQKALDGLFKLVAQEEALIRKDPVARGSDILKTVFGTK